MDGQVILKRSLRELEKGIIYKSEEKYQQLYTVY